MWDKTHTQDSYLCTLTHTRARCSRLKARHNYVAGYPNGACQAAARKKPVFLSSARKCCVLPRCPRWARQRPTARCCARPRRACSGRGRFRRRGGKFRLRFCAVSSSPIFCVSCHNILSPIISLRKPPSVRPRSDLLQHP